MGKDYMQYLLPSHHHQKKSQKKVKWGKVEADSTLGC